MSALTVAIDARLATTRNTGDTSYWRGLLRGLATIESDATFLLYSNAPRPEWIPEGGKFRWVHLEGPSRWWSLVKFPLAARRAGAQVVHTQYTLSPLAYKRGVTTVHDVSFLIEPDWFKPKDRILLQWQVPASCRRARKVLTVSETSKEEIARLIPGTRQKIVVTPNALGDNITPVPPGSARAWAKENVGVGRYLLALGTRWPRKNLRLAVEAFRRLPSDYGLSLVVAGQPGWGDEEQCPGVVYTGYVSDQDLSRLYSGAELFLLTSLHEGFGIPILEAFACGCPVVCGPAGAASEVAGGAAHVTSGYDPAEWAGAVTSLLADSSNLAAMRARGQERLAHYDWGKTARLTLDVYNEVGR
ncbi:MAG: glycosyltransferase family 4 protein [Fimbriimonadaceae bacterium]|nr:glycosyltransferase family 4 protein [Fimbriimonadaceae bacterium]